MTPFRLSQLKRLLGRRRARRQPAATFPRPRLELLEDRVVPSTDPYTLYTYGDAYTGAPGQDQKSFLKFYQPFDEALGGSSVLPLVQSTPNVSDPGSPGPFAVTTQEYNLGDLAFRPTDIPWATSGIELTGSIKAPTDLGNTAHPVVVLLHGRHATTYDPVSGNAFLEWPATGNHLSIPSYRGYDYLGDVLASQGYVVVSIGADGINARDNGAADAGALARAQLIQRTFGILQDLNTDGVIHTRPADATHPGTDLFTGTSSPFGTRFVGKLDLQNIGLMGHSRGGEGVVRSYLLNQALGSPYGIKAVFALAPIDFQNELINNVPFAVLLPYNDGDVSNLQGAHFFDDSRYNVPGDTGPKFSIEVMGANHNFYNTVWSPGLFPFPGAPDRFGGTLDEGVPAPPSRLTETQQQGTGLAYMSAFFRTYLGGETRFLPILTGDVAPPPSAQVAPDRIHIGYLPPDSAAVRRDVNRLLTTANQTTNTLGGAVLTGGLTTYTIGGPVSGEANRGNQLSLGYSSTLTAFYENDLPAGARDERIYNDLQLRIGVAYTDTRNPLNANQDYSVMLIDGGGHSYSTLVSAWSDALFYPPQSAIPHEVLNTVRIPLRAFYGFIDLSNVTAIRFNFDQHNSGAFQIADLAFADLGAAGPYVVDSAPARELLGPQSSVRVQFDRPIKVETFTIDSIVSFTRTAGATVTDLLSAITGVTPVAGSDGRQFDIAFDSQGLAGVYRLTIGPNIQDEAGNPMDQNHNLLAGEDADTYTATFTILGPKIISGTPTGNANVPDPTRKVRVTFNEPVNPATFTANQVLASGPQGVIVVSAVAPVSDSNNTQFDITFPQIVTGDYTVVIGPDIQDFAGNKMDQNDNFVGGEQPGDLYVLQFGVQGLKVTSSSLNSDVPGEADSVHLTFSEPVALSSFTRAAVTLIGPDGAHAIRKVVPANIEDSARQRDTTVTQFDVLFSPLTVAGNYTVTVAANVSDIYGNLMDEDDNRVPGESSDAYTATLVVAGPRVTGATAGTGRPVDHAVVTFDRPMDLSSFSTNSFALTGPSGSPIAITGVSRVPHTKNFQIEVDFAPSSAPGRYTLTVRAGVADAFGNVLAADAATNFQVNYTATATAFQDIEIFGQAGTQTLHFGSDTGPVTADDDFGTISLGSNSFTFYGQTYSQLFVSSNGVITFGGGTSAIVPVGDSRFNPSLAYIAAYWTDLFKSGTEPMIVWQISGNQLIIEWYRVTIFDGSPPMTFQAILQLNTGGAPGDIVLNYSSVTGTGDGPEDVGVTVGIKDAGTASDVARTLVEDGTHFSSTGSPLVQTGRAVRFTAS